MLDPVLKAMREAHSQAGYVGEDDIHMAYDGGDRWVIVVKDDDGGSYMVGEFFKPTCTQTGEYDGQPLEEGLDLGTALTVANAVAKVRFEQAAKK